MKVRTLPKLPCFLVICVLLADTSRVQSEESGSSSDLRCAGAVRWPEPVNIPKTWNSTPCLSANGQELLFTSTRDDWGTYVATRTNVAEAFQEVKKMIGGNHGVLSADGLSCYFNDSGPHGKSDIYVAHRSTIGAEWESPHVLGNNVNSADFERWAAVSSDGLEIYFTRSKEFEANESEIWCAKKASPNEDFGKAEPLPGVVNDGTANSASVSPDGLLLFFVSMRDGGKGGADIWIACRDDRKSPWKDVINAGPNVNSPESEWQPMMTLDGRKLLFSRSPNEVDWDNLNSAIFEANVLRD